MASKFLLKILTNSRNPASSSSLIRPTTSSFLVHERSCHTERKGAAKKSKSRKNLLFQLISPLGDPHIRITPVLDRWVLDDKKLDQLELRRIVRHLRTCKRYSQALEVSDWIRTNEVCALSSSDLAVHLDLVGRVQGHNSAETAFNNMTDIDKDVKIYGALLNCYVREGLVDQSLTIMQKMRELGFTLSTLDYNNLMCVYTRTGQLEKVPEVHVEMKENGVSYDNISYRICMNSYGARSDLTNMERVLSEMENDTNISMDWTTYSAVANFYLKEGLKDKAIFYLNKCEEKVDKEALGYNHLISHYANLGNKDKILELWTLQKTMCKKVINSDYVTLLNALLKIDEIGETEKFLNEWEPSCKTYDFRVPNILLIGYSQRGMIEKAEALLREKVEKGKIPTPNSWSIISDGYMEKENMKKAFECFKEALSVEAQNKKWRPKSDLISRILCWLGEEGEVEEVEGFVEKLKSKVETSREMYHALIKANIRHGNKVDELLKNMKADGLDEDDETKQILGSP